MAYLPMYVVKNFQNYYTLDMPGGTTTSPTFIMTVTESLTSFPTTFPVLLEVWDTDETFAATVEFMICTGANVIAKQLTISTRGVDDTSIYNHINGSKVAINIAALNTNNMINNIDHVNTEVGTKLATATYNTLLLQGNVPLTTLVTTAEAYPATSTDPNGGGAGLSITGPTLLIHPEGGAKRPDASVSAEGGAENLCVAYEASTGAAETKRVYLPGSIVSGFTGLVEGAFYFPSGVVVGAWSRTIGNYWRIAGRATSSTTMLILEGRSSRNLTDRGTGGTSLFNNGTLGTAARSDHEHKISVQWTPILQAPFTGQTSIWFANKTTLTYDIITAYAVCNGVLGSTATTLRIEKTSQTDIDGAASGWASIMSTVITIDASERSSNTATAPVFSTSTIAPGEHVRVYVIGAGTGVGDIQVFLSMKIKNTN
jgi:hypothetical protein